MDNISRFDWFAGMALQGFVQSRVCCNPDVITRDAKAIAAAMVADDGREVAMLKKISRSDWFAGMALRSLVQSRSCCNPDVIVKESKAIAAAMVAEEETVVGATKGDKQLEANELSLVQFRTNWSSLCFLCFVNECSKNEETSIL